MLALFESEPRLCLTNAETLVGTKLSECIASIYRLGIRYNLRWLWSLYWLVGVWIDEFDLAVRNLGCIIGLHFAQMDWFDFQQLLQEHR